VLIAALILAVVGLAALITAVATGNELIAWVCIGASGLGVLLLIVDAIRERSRLPVRRPAVAAAAPAAVESTEVIEAVESTEVIEAVESAGQGDDTTAGDHEYQDGADSFAAATDVALEDHPEELVYDDPVHDMPSDDEAEFPEPAQQAALHVITDDAGAAYVVEEYGTPETEQYGAEESPVEPAHDLLPAESATEIRYISSAEGGADTVYTYAESAETEYVEARDYEVDERREL